LRHAKYLVRVRVRVRVRARARVLGLGLGLGFGLVRPGRGVELIVLARARLLGT